MPAHQIRPVGGQVHDEMPRQPIPAGHFPDRHRRDVPDQLAGQPAGDVGTAADDDLGVLFPVPFVAAVAVEATSHPLQRRSPTLRRQVVHPDSAAVVDPAGLEPAMRAADEPASVGDLDHETFDQGIPPNTTISATTYQPIQIVDNLHTP